MAMKPEDAFVQALGASMQYTKQSLEGAGAIKGDKGDKGDPGPQGPAGPKGDTGDVGPAGATGPKGDTGEQGPQGPKGDKGDTGAAGKDGKDGSVVEVTQVLSTGTEIAEIDVNGNAIKLYAPQGGGTGGGHTIEDSEGTDLTQRDTLQFGEGFKAEDDDTNEKTVISPDVMQSGDISDVITPLPSVQPRYQKYSTEEQIVGTWINGDTVYQKTVVETGTSSASSGFDYININLVTGVDTLIEANGMIYDGNGRVYSTGGTMGDSLGTVSVMGRFGIDNHTVMYTALNNMAVVGSNNLTIKATIRYTKVSS